MNLIIHNDDEDYFNWTYWRDSEDLDNRVTKTSTRSILITKSAHIFVHEGE